MTATQPYTVPKMRAGIDYQVAHARLINGRNYRPGEILDTTGLTQRVIEMYREQRIILDVPLGGEPLLPIPDPVSDAPLTPEEKAAMLAAGTKKPKGRVTPKNRGFGIWFAMDEDDEKHSLGFKDDRIACQKVCNEINLANGLELTAADLDGIGNTNDGAV